MAPVGREKYLDATEVKQLRETSAARAALDLQRGRSQGALTWMIVDLALSTGLRVSELVRVTCGDINLRRGSLRVWRLKRRTGPQRETIALGKELAGHLRTYLEWKVLRDEATGPGDPLLVGKRGPLTARGLQQAWKVAIKRSGLPVELSIHCARHTAATHLLRRTGNLRIVQRQLGHASVSTTANLYCGIAFEDLEAALSGLYAE